MVTSGVTVRVSIIRGCEVLVGKYGWGSVKSVGAYHERERLCPEGMEVWEVARVHYSMLPFIPYVVDKAQAAFISRRHIGDVIQLI